MVEALISLISNPVLYIMTIIILLILVFTGKLKVKEGKVSVNDSGSHEREILRTQLGFAHTFCRGFTRLLPENENKIEEDFVIEMLYNIFVDAIALNHITLNEAYISTKQELAWNTVSTVTGNPIYEAPEVKEIIFERVKKLITELYGIRKSYS